MLNLNYKENTLEVCVGDSYLYPEETDLDPDFGMVTSDFQEKKQQQDKRHNAVFNTRYNLNCYNLFEKTDLPVIIFQTLSKSLKN